MESKSPQICGRRPPLGTDRTDRTVRSPAKAHAVIKHRERATRAIVSDEHALVLSLTFGDPTSGY